MPQQTTHSPFHRYLQRLSLWVVVVLLATVGMNRLIDPYGIYPSPRVEGLNAVKPEFFSHLRLAKAIAVKRSKPGAIVLGTSRAEIGIDPDHPGWGAAPVYNLALSSCNIYEAFRYLQHAHAIQPLEQVVLMVDFFMFDAVGNLDKVNFDESILAVDVEGKPQARGVGAEITTLFSLDTIFASLKTVINQATGHNIIYLPNGMRDHRSGVRWLWHRKATQKNENDNFQFAYQRRDNLAIYRRLLQLVYTQGIDLRIAVSPSHARQFETIAAKGLWPLFEEWKQQLVQINEKEAKQAGSDSYPIWDFSGYNSMTTEPVPPLGDVDSPMQWYRDPSHYKAELGYLVLDRIFGYDHPGRLIPDDFGVLLTPESINAHLQQIREDREQWRASFPEDAAEIDALKGTGGEQ
jgi:hypothetical protein